MTMLRKIVEVLVCGAVGAAAIYTVAHVAYQAGKDAAYEELKAAVHRTDKDDETDASRESSANEVNAESGNTASEVAKAPVRKKRCGKLGMIFGALRIFSGRKTVLGRLIKNPEEHRLEAYVEGGELQIHIRPKRLRENRNGCYGKT